MLDWKDATRNREQDNRPPQPYLTVRIGAVRRGGTQQ